MRNKFIGAGLALVLGLGGAAVATVPASAHTPNVTSTCKSVTANLTSYEYVAGKEAVFGTRVVTAGVAFKAAVYGEAPLISPYVAAQPAVFGIEHELVQKNGNSEPRWELEGNFPGKGWEPTGVTRATTIKAATSEIEAVYGPAPLITPEVAAVAEVTEQYVITPAVEAKDNSVTFVIDGVASETIRFGTSYSGTKEIDGTKNHTYKVVIDAIGTQYDKTVSGTTTACVVPIVEIPYPTLIADVECGPANDKNFRPNAEWVAKYGPFVAGPWVDGKWKTQNGKTVVDGSAQIKSEFRKTHIWAGTGSLTASDFRRWQMYPGTSPFIYEDTNTECPVIVPEKPADTVTVVVTEEEDCDTDLITSTTTTTTVGTELIENKWIETAPVVKVETAARPMTDAELKDCPVVTPPVVDPPVVTPPVVTPPIVADPPAAPISTNPTPVAAPQAAALVKAPVSSAQVLASTGVEVGLWVALGLLLLVIGGILRVLSLRKTHSMNS